MFLRVGIIGAGLMGEKRACALPKRHTQLIAVADQDYAKALSLAQKYKSVAYRSWQEIIKRKDIDAVIVSVYNIHAAKIIVAALKNKKHVFCEKPMGSDLYASRRIYAQAAKKEAVLKVGFNLRFHPAIIMAKRLLDGGSIGKTCSMRCRYGHGGRPGYDSEWRTNKKLSGGGELLDQGIHAVDLFRFFAGDFSEVCGFVTTAYWKIKVEDNAFALFKNSQGVVASMHVSWTQWKNIFSVEILGDKGYLLIEGLGGNYGMESLTFGLRMKSGRAPKEKKIFFPVSDHSWANEWKDFVKVIGSRGRMSGNFKDGLQASRMIAAIYDSAKKGKTVRIN